MIRRRVEGIEGGPKKVVTVDQLNPRELAAYHAHLEEEEDVVTLE